MRLVMHVFFGKYRGVVTVNRTGVKVTKRKEQKERRLRREKEPEGGRG